MFQRIMYRIRNNNLGRRLVGGLGGAVASVTLAACVKVDVANEHHVVGYQDDQHRVVYHQGGSVGIPVTKILQRGIKCELATAFLMCAKVYVEQERVLIEKRHERLKETARMFFNIKQDEKDRYFAMAYLVPAALFLVVLCTLQRKGW